MGYFFLPICIATCRLVVVKGRKGRRGVRWEASVIRHACHSAANISPSTVNTPVSRPTPGVFPSQEYDDRTTLGTSGHSQCQQIRLGPVRSTDVKNVSCVFILVTFFNFPNDFLFLKNVGKVQSGKQINKKHFQHNSNEIQWVHN